MKQDYEFRTFLNNNTDTNYSINKPILAYNGGER